jgi:2-C-methyl-D-erythritol 4-phosphate cytidylyltransferase/2-C-methyl-D-erythritol 2,4-cyclodiphosphate synthase
VPHDLGLLGHSDADVAFHAITDAILGAIAAGDIGSHFPPSDERWRDAESSQFLRHAASLLADRGGRVENVDLVIVCERPKIGPHRAAMAERTAAVLGIGIDRVGIKATTSEGLGFTGRGEGIAAQAVVSIAMEG